MSVSGYGHGAHPGRVRRCNEDSLLVDDRHSLWLIADGMGGHNSGDVASRVAVDYVHEAVVRKGVSLLQAVREAHTIIQIAADQMLGLTGMGTTFVGCRLHGHRYEVVWVGDSRAYLCDGEGLRRLTRDHSYVQQLLDAGQIGEEEAARHPCRHVITQALGAVDLAEVEVERVEGDFCRGQQILLCSDGLTSALDEKTICRLLQDSALDEQGKVDRLISLSLERGGGDNISVIVLSAPDDAPEMGEWDTTQSLTA